NAPWFRLLSQQANITVKVFYTWSQSAHGAKYDPGFGKVVDWDIPLLDGYDYMFVNNVATHPGSHHRNGIDNPTLNADITRWKPDAILVIGWSYKSHFSCMRYFKDKVPVLFRGDSTLLDEQPGIRRKFRRIALNYVYSFVDYALYVGANNKNYFLAHGLKEHQLIFAPHAIDNDRFASDGTTYIAEAMEWRKKLGIKAGDFVVLYAAKLEPKKDPGFMLKLAAAMPAENIKFVLVGNGELEKELKEMAQNDKRIIFIDFQNQGIMPVVYRLGDIFVLPSKGPEETWGLAVNEAMACGLPVIVSNKAGCAIDLVSDRNGIIIAPGDTEACKEYIESLLNDLSKLMEAGRASKQQIADYSFAGIVKGIGQAITNIKRRDIKTAIS
ncbi:MAG TPA: glycosyltransferase family 4 protein, partial [Candidatus Babeliaceae bacterium]|nr:glycosyltransferase family 4 protein [Candidatus Babeliaceae bacterium]